LCLKNIVYYLGFDPEDCPPDCSKPCEKVCPADAISLEHSMVGGEHTGSDPLRGKYEVSVALVLYFFYSAPVIFFISFIFLMSLG
jgi:hypothetical protein